MPTREIYLDNAATTRIDDDVVKAMLPYLKDEYGNPGSFNTRGMKARDAVEEARSVVSRLLHVKTSEITFTSGGTESINLALKGVMRANREKGDHLITTVIEHPAVLETCKYLEKYEGVKVTYLPVDQQGLVHVKDVEKAITPKTVLMSIMYANNEIGTIQDIPALGKLAKSKGIYFHTDACQAGLLDLDVTHLQIDLMTLNGSKLHGPKGTGILYKRSGVPMHPLLHGGGQEGGVRSGTENVAGIVGFARALSLTQEDREKESKRLVTLRDHLIQGIQKIPDVALNGHPTQRLPSHVSATFKGVDSEALLIALNEYGIYASFGSACASKKIGPSHVIIALGVPEKKAQGTLRFTLGKYTTKEDIVYVLKVLPDVVKKLRSIHP
jgi:cysteine desulfurase